MDGQTHFSQSLFAYWIKANIIQIVHQQRHSFAWKTKSKVKWHCQDFYTKPSPPPSVLVLLKCIKNYLITVANCVCFCCGSIDFWMTSWLCPKTVRIWNMVLSPCMRKSNNLGYWICWSSSRRYWLDK